MVDKLVIESIHIRDNNLGSAVLEFRFVRFLKA
jgi:hypothetical protein